MNNSFTTYIPKLQANGLNQVLYKNQFLLYIKTQELAYHIDGSVEALVTPKVTSIVVSTPELVSVVPRSEIVQVTTVSTSTEGGEDYRKELAKWKRGESMVK